MSPLLRDELRVMLYPDHATVTRIARAITRRGLSRRVTARTRLACQPQTDGDMRWSAALARLDQALPDLGGAAHATVILSNHFVRYAVVPWSEALIDPAEEDAYARHCFRRQYGVAAEHWDLRLNAPRPGASRLASAVDRRLLDALRAPFMREGMPLRSIQPHLMAIFNQCRGLLQERNTWFVLHEPGILCIALLQDASWRLVRTIRAGSDWAASLPLLLMRETYMADAEPEAETVCLWAPALGVASAPACGAWPLRNLMAAMPGDFIPDDADGDSVEACP